LTSDAQETPRTVDELKSLTFGFDEQPLEHFRGLSAEEIEAHAGIGPKFRERIQEALAELAALTGESEPAAAAEPAQPAESVAPETHGDDAPADHGHAAAGETLEPVAPGTGGPALVVVMVALILMLLVAVVMITRRQDGSAELQVQLTEANQQVASQQQTFQELADSAATEAHRQATAAYAATHERDLGNALRQLEDLQASLATIRTALPAAAGPAAHAVVSEHGEGVPAEPDQQALLAAAEAALDETHAALMLTQPQTQASLEAACQRLEQAVRALHGDEVKE